LIVADRSVAEFLGGLMSKTINAKDLQISLDDANEEGLFRWLIASFLMGKRIQTEIAANAYKVIVDQYQIDTPRKLANCSRRELVAMLGEARYVRYDQSTATRLLAFARKINEEYSGRVGNIFEVSGDHLEVEKRLKEFDGIGPKTVEIFMREAEKVIFLKVQVDCI
jgi:endonuclease III